MTPNRSAVSAHRERMRRRGLVRVELRLRKEDATLLRNVAGALADPGLAAGARALLREHFGPREIRGLKALLAAAPLDDIELDRTRDTGRTVEL